MINRRDVIHALKVTINVGTGGKYMANKKQNTEKTAKSKSQQRKEVGAFALGAAAVGAAAAKVAKKGKKKKTTLKIVFVNRLFFKFFIESNYFFFGHSADGM